jgi:hypothetical protein
VSGGKDGCASEGDGASSGSPNAGKGTLDGQQQPSLEEMKGEG